MNQTFQRLNMIMGWVTFGIAALVYALTAEPTGSLWDCGEFVSAAHKLQVVHPPGAPLFLMVGRLFAIVGETFSSDPQTIAYMINLSSGICTAFLVLFIFWSTTILSKLALVGRYGEIENVGQMWAILGSGLAAGLASTFATSVWFSAVEGEVYAMSSFFTGLVLWAGLRWFISEDTKADRWLVFISYMVGLSIGVHLLSLLIIPFVALLYYYKNYTNTEDKLFPFLGTLIAGATGSAILVFVQYFIIPRVPAIAAAVDYFFVNSFGLGVGVGMLTFALVLALGMGVAIWLATKENKYLAQLALTSVAMVLIGFSTYGMIVIRANTNLPINMNAPADPYSLLSYLNREQYGDRPLFYGPHFNAQPPAGGDRYKDGGNVYRPVTDAKGKTRYEVVDKKTEPVYNPKDMMLFPRLGHMDRVPQYMGWLKHSNEVEAEFRACVMQNGGNQQACGALNPNNPNAYRAWLARKKKPTQVENIGFFLNYQVGHMYVRYFMWNFVGRQNAQQNFHTDSRKYQVGNWLSGIGFIDELYTHQQSNLPKYISEDKSRNTYYFLPLIFGFMGMFFHFSKRPKEAFAIFALFILTGLAIIMFLNQPPQEPRERDYAFAGSIFTFCIWIGMAIPLLYETMHKSMGHAAAAVLSACMVLTAPIIMGYQNWDDHSRAGHYGARDYAINFLESCAPNAILFTYGDNDTYPLWYAQEVEGIRTDVRVVNFSLLAVDWYINQLRYKVNKSERVKMTISPDAYRGKNRNFAPFSKTAANSGAMNLASLIKFIGEPHPLPEYGSNAQSHVPTKSVFIPIDKAKLRANGSIPASVPDSLVADTMYFGVDGEYLVKDEIALLDIIASNGWERPIYFAVTCRPEKVMGLKDYLQMEGMALRIVPYKTLSAPDMLMNMGRVDVDAMFTNVTEKFRWGGFDKKDMFVDESYMPSVQTTQYGMMRLATELMRLNQQDKAVKVADKFFEGFPNMNFPFAESRIITRDGKTVLMQMLSVYYMSAQESKAKVHIQTLAEGLIDKQTFFAGLSGTDLITFEEDSQMNLFLMENLLNFVSIGKDADLLKELEAKFAPFKVALKPAPNPIPQDKLTPTDTSKK